jgi:DNA-directed RNA polymerase subunit RPC12/RpoP
LVNVIRTFSVANGYGFSVIEVYECATCKKEIVESYPHHLEGDKTYCVDCSFINGFIKDTEYLESIGINFSNAHAVVWDGQIITWVGKKSPWERKDKDYRNTKEYRDWRNKVFQRDDYTCQHCGQKGGELNAHHIKPFAKHKRLRFEVSIGLTLCIDCHRKEHKRLK